MNWAMHKRRGSRALNEFERIDRFLKPLAKGFAGARDLMDDAAALAPPPGHEFVISVDALVSGVHFLPDDPPAQVAKKALRVNLSDLAAKGAKPFAYFLTMALPSAVDDTWLALFSGGLAEDQETYGIRLAGGDTVSTPGPVTLSITAMGTLPRGGMVPRDGARVGDRVLVTGTIGDSYLGLGVLQGRRDFLDNEHRHFVVDRYRLPQPRDRLADAVRDHATACLDISDGLVADFGHMAAAAGVGIRLNAEAIPLSLAARSAVRTDPGLLTRLVTGGDDYELAISVPADRVSSIISDAKSLRVPLTDIGAVTAPTTGGPGVLVIGQGGSMLGIEGSGGYVHR